MNIFSKQGLKRPSVSIPARVGQEVQKRNFNALLNLLSTSCAVFSVLLLLAVLSKIDRIEHQPLPTLVQKSDGGVIEVEDGSSSYRSPQVIKKFVTDSLYMLMSWSREMPAQADGLGNKKALRDLGMMVKTDSNQDVLIPTSVFYASFAFTEKDNFRDSLLKRQIATMVAKTKVMEGMEKTALVFRSVTPPEPVPGAVGKWRVTIVADFLRWNVGTANTERVTFNKDVYVQTADMPPLPTGKEANLLEQVINTMRHARLEIYEMREMGLAPPQATGVPGSSNTPFINKR